MKKRKIYYKLTTPNGQTYNKTQWGDGMTHSGAGRGALCTGGWIHVYDHPLLAVFLNPTHANFQNPLLWEAEGWGKMLDDNGLKRGVEHCATLRQIALPEVTTINRVAFGILCALEVYTEPQWRHWAEGWLSGKDRSKKTAAEAAAWAAWAAVAAAAVAAAAAAEAAEAEAEAAEAAAWAAVAEAAAAAAEAGAGAAKKKPLNLIALAEQAMGVE